jgi:1-acyl-sn-glycerol-3-phosphate acyltransferase
LNNMEPWQYETVDDLDQSMIDRLRRFPREPDILVYSLRIIAALMLRAWLKVYHRLSIIGKENLPQEGSYVLVANHASHLDAISILAALPMRKLYRVFPAAAKDYFFVSVPRTALSAVVVNALPFNRETNIRQSLNLCKQLLENPGNVLLIFPEGTRSMTGELGDFKPGVGLLLAGVDVPVVPCYLEGAFKAWPKGKLFPRPRRVRLVIGEPHRYSNMKHSKETAVSICQDLRNAILSLSTHLRIH